MPPSAEESLTIDGGETNDNYHQQMRDALEQNDTQLLRSAVSHPSFADINRSFTYKMDKVFQLPSSTVHSAVQQDVCKRVPNETVIYAVHYTALKGYQQCLQILLDAGANPNVKDSLGQTPLHILAKIKLEDREQDYKECLNNLLAQKAIKADRVDMSGATPLQRAEEHRWRYMIDQLEAFQTSTEKVEQHGLGKSDTLLQLVIYNNFTEFTNTLDTLKDSGMKAKAILDDNHGSYTLLQYACRCAMPNFVDVLLRHGASVAVKHDNNLLSPILCASRHANHKILKRLLEAIMPVDLQNGVLKEFTNHLETALHLLVKLKPSQETNNVDYFYCLETLISSINHIDINAQDDAGNTALHSAAMEHDLETIRTLLRNGAKIDIENIAGKKAISYIDKPGMLGILDDCIDYDRNLSIIDKEFKITVNFNVMTKGSIEEAKEGELTGQDTPPTEMNFLNTLTEHHKDIDILYHPIIDIFLYIKWQKIKWYGILNILLHIIFQLGLMTYIILYHAMDNQIPQRSDGNDTEGAVNVTVPAAVEMEAENIIWQYVRLVFMISLVLAMALRELTQLLMMRSLCDYICDMKNLIEIAIVILTILLFSLIHETAQEGVAAWLVLLSFLELVLLMGDIPECAIYVEMFRKVAWNFFMFICMFSTTIIAFSFSFYLMFRKNEKFSSFPQSLMKTVIMSTGEIEYGDLITFPIASQIMLVLFVFIILLVLMNLLNGLAISDIQAIQKEAEIINRRNLMNCISLFEGAFESLNYHNPIKRLHNWVSGTLSVFKRCLPHHQLIIYPNRHAIQYGHPGRTEGLAICSCHAYKLEDKHIQSLKSIVIEKRQII